jgi:hypothetical protein
MIRRCTRLSNGFSRKIEKHATAVAIDYSALQSHHDPPFAPDVARDGGRRCGSMFNVSDLVDQLIRSESK